MRAVPRSARSFSWLTACQERGRHHQPADAERRREGLAGRAGVDDAVGVESLERADGRAVVAVLGVVVVLDRDRVARAQPGQQRRSSFAAEHDARGVLVRGRQHDRVGVGALEFVDPGSGFVDPDQNRLAGRRARRRGASSGLLGSSSAIRLRAGRRERVADHAQALRVAAGDDDLLGIGDDAAHAAEVVRQRAAQHLDPAGVAVAEVGVGHRRERARAASAAMPRAGTSRRPARWDGSRTARGAARAGAAARPARRPPPRRRRAGGRPGAGSDSPRRRAGRRRPPRPGAKRRAGAPGHGWTAPAHRVAGRRRGSSVEAGPRSVPRASGSRRGSPRAAARSADWSRLRPRFWIFHLHQSKPSIARMHSITLIRRRATAVRHLDPRSAAAGDAQHRAAGPRPAPDRLVRRGRRGHRRLRDRASASAGRCSGGSSTAADRPRCCWPAPPWPPRCWSRSRCCRRAPRSPCWSRSPPASGWPRRRSAPACAAQLPALLPDPGAVRAAYALEASVVELTYIFGPPLALCIGALWSTGAALAAGGIVLLARDRGVRRAAGLAQLAAGRRPHGDRAEARCARRRCGRW